MSTDLEVIKGFAAGQSNHQPKPPSKDSPWVTWICIAIAFTIVGGVIGWYAGRKALERDWGKPTTTLSDIQVKAMHESAGEGNPVPKPGITILRPMPIGISRHALAEFVKSDRVVVSFGAVGRDETSTELHLIMRNNAGCTVVAYEGVAYAFDAYGKPAVVNKAGAHFLAFQSTTESTIAVGARYQHSASLVFSERGNMVIAHVDSWKCDDGTSWTRKAPSAPNAGGV